MSEKRTLLPIGPFGAGGSGGLEPALYELHVDGERVADVGVRIGYCHRGVERLSTERSWGQVVELAARLGSGESAAQAVAYVRAVEELAGITVPLRAKYIRTVVLELERLATHLMWLGLFGRAAGSDALFMWSWAHREPVLLALESITGSRIICANSRIGGERRDLDDGLLAALKDLCGEMGPRLDMLKGTVEGDRVMAGRMKGAGVLSNEEALARGVVGPVARASGVATDVRRDDPYAAYDLIEWDVIVSAEGDVYARAMVRLLEMEQSLRIIAACVDAMPDGPVRAETGGVPAGDGIGHVETARGETFHWVRSDGGRSPARHHVRAASYMNLQGLRPAVIGATVADAALIIMSVDPCQSCAARAALVGEEDQAP